MSVCKISLKDIFENDVVKMEKSLSYDDLEKYYFELYRIYGRLKKENTTKWFYPTQPIFKLVKEHFFNKGFSIRDTTGDGYSVFNYPTLTISK
jgi:hypothetical protein